MGAPEWKLWLDLVQWLLTLGVCLSVWLRKPGESAGKAVDELREQHAGQLSDHRDRITALEIHIQHMPDEGEFRTLEGQVKEIGQSVHGIRESLEPIRKTLVRIEDFLLHSRLPSQQ